MGLTLRGALRFEGPCSAAFVGAGGKTTAMFQLARQLPPPVIVTTTTHLGAWQTSLADRHVIATRPAELAGLDPRGVTLISGDLTSRDRVAGLNDEVLSWLRDMVRQQKLPLLIEADGARQKMLKAPGADEPVIPGFTDLVIVVAGLSGIGTLLLEDVVHRSERFAELSGLKMGDVITAEALVRVMKHPEGGLKGIPAEARRVALLTQAESPGVQAQARLLARSLLGAYDAVVVASLREEQIHAVHERVAGIILAAGGSVRLGRPKQLLDWRGQPFVRAVAETALRAGLDPVVVVTGAVAAEVIKSLEGLQVKIVHNGAWESGQASSIRAGLQALPPSTGAAVFLLADQPQVTFDVIAALVDLHATGLQPIVAPLVREERRANPVLFDRAAFPDLLKLEGDVGGRAIFPKHRVEYMPWHDERLVLDVDTEADYRRLVEEETP